MKTPTKTQLVTVVLLIASLPFIFRWVAIEYMIDMTHPRANEVVLALFGVMSWVSILAASYLTYEWHRDVLRAVMVDAHAKAREEVTKRLRKKLLPKY